jgi:hypothetical protein
MTSEHCQDQQHLLEIDPPYKMSQAFSSCGIVEIGLGRPSSVLTCMHVVYDAALTSLLQKCHWYLTERGKANHLHDLRILTTETGVLLTADLQALKETRHWLSAASLRLHDAGTQPFTSRDCDIEKAPHASKSHPGCCLAPSLFSRRPVLVVQAFLLAIPYSQPALLRQNRA